LEKVDGHGILDVFQYKILIEKAAGFAYFFPASLLDLSAWSKKNTILDKKQTKYERKKTR